MSRICLNNEKTVEQTFEQSQISQHSSDKLHTTTSVIRFQGEPATARLRAITHVSVNLNQSDTYEDLHHVKNNFRSHRKTNSLILGHDTFHLPAAMSTGPRDSVQSVERKQSFFKSRAIKMAARVCMETGRKATSPRVKQTTEQDSLPRANGVWKHVQAMTKLRSKFMARCSVRTRNACWDSNYQSAFKVGAHMEKRANRKRRRQRRKKKTRFRFKCLAKVVSLLLRIWRIHSLAMQTYLRQVQAIDLSLDYRKEDSILFDLTKYKADREPRLSAKAMRILKKLPTERTPEEMRHVQIALWNYKSLAEYPLHIQKRIAARAWIESYEPKRVIVREGDYAARFYFLLSGGAFAFVIDQDKELAKTLTYYSRGDSFGESAILNGCKHQSTVVSQVAVQLLVLTSQDFLEVIMSGGLKNPADPFLNSLSYLDGWPKEKLTENPKKALYIYFRRGTIVVPESRENEWIVIVKSGSCSLLSKLSTTAYTQKYQSQKVPTSLRENVRHAMKEEQAKGVSHEAFLDFIQKRREVQTDHLDHLYKRYKALPPIITKIGERDSERVRKEEQFQVQDVAAVNTPSGEHQLSPERCKLNNDGDVKEKSQNLRKLGALVAKGPFMARRKPQLPDHSIAKLGDNINHTASASDRQLPAAPSAVKPTKAPHSVYVSVQTLTKGMAFGLSDMVFPHQPPLTLVSNGAECLMVGKKLLLDHATPDFLARLQEAIHPYPCEEDLQRYLDLQLTWDAHRRAVATGVWHGHRWSKADKNDCRLHPAGDGDQCVS